MSATRSHPTAPQQIVARLSSSTAKAHEVKIIACTLAPAVLALMCWMLADPIAQPDAYHSFHDARSLMGIPNFFNVVSNAPFALIGMAGLAMITRRDRMLPAHLKACYATMFIGIAVTAIGSAIYHWSPDNGSLVWDRLPMAIAFMGLFAGFLSERLQLSARTSQGLLAILLTYGAGSVFYWAAFDDLRLYVVAQFYPIIAIPVLMWRFAPTYTHDTHWLAALGIYVAAKALEEGDGLVFAAAEVVSGHTLKHLAAAAGAYCIYRMLSERQPLTARTAST